MNSERTSQPQVTTAAERARGVESWFMLAAPDVHRARDEWNRMGAALLRCGDLFTVVCVPGTIIRAAADCDDPTGVDAFLAETLSGPVFASAGLSRYYALVPAGTFWDWGIPGTQCLPAGTYVGVPAPRAARYQPGIEYWASPMQTPGDLCDEVEVGKLALAGVKRLGEKVLSEQGLPS